MIVLKELTGSRNQTKEESMTTGGGNHRAEAR